MKILFSIAAIFISAVCIHAQVNQDWAQTYSPGNNNAVALDNSGNIYTTGSSGSSMLLQKYDAAGNLLWTQTIIPAGATTGLAYAVAVDGNGDVIITGRGNAGATVKYDASGQLLWSVATTFYSQSLAIDGSNNIYICGVESGNLIKTVKLDPSGVLQWTSTYNADPDNGGSISLLNKKVIFKNGFVYVSGVARMHLSGTPGGTRTNVVLTVKYNASNGAQVWAATYSHADKISQYAIDLTADGVGNVYVTGVVYIKAGKNQNINWVTLKYNSSGAQQWASIYDGNGNDYTNNSTSVGTDFPSAIILDNSGNIIVTGGSYTTSGQFTSQDMTTVKYSSSSGSQVWAKTYDGPAHEDDHPHALATDASSNIYITGGTGVSNRNATTIQYNSSGIQQWVMNYDGGATIVDRGLSICTDNSNNIYVAGRTGTSSLLLKYSQTAPPIVNRQPNIDEATVTTINIFPNPSTNQLTIRNSDNKMLSNIIIYNAAGKIVYQNYVGSPQTAIDLQRFVSGVYFLRTDQMTASIKFVKQ